MSDYYDELETRAPPAREREQFGNLPGLIAKAIGAPGWTAQLSGVDPRPVTSRAALAQLPVLRKYELKDLQRARPPLGGFATSPPGALKRLLMSPGPIGVEGLTMTAGKPSRATIASTSLSAAILLRL